MKLWILFFGSQEDHCFDKKGISTMWWKRLFSKSFQNAFSRSCRSITMRTVASTTTSTGILIFYIQQQDEVESSSSASAFFSGRTYCDASSAAADSNGGPSLLFRISNLRRRATIRQMEKTAARESFASQYRISKILGEGAFGKVYLGEHIATGEAVAIKKINKACTDNITFQREMDALLRLREKGCHPNICSMRGMSTSSLTRLSVVWVKDES
jgi:hypothetical protein